MIELIATIILICSLGGIAIILLRKTPILIELPKTVEKAQKESLTLRLRGKMKNTFPPKEIILQKILSRFRILTLKTEKKTDSLLQSLRKKTQQNQMEEKSYPLAKFREETELGEEIEKTNNQEPKNLPG